MPIPHVDVRAQYAPLIPELQDAFTRTLESGRFIFGPEVEAFEREAAAHLGTADAVSCANGTDALVLAPARRRCSLRSTRSRSTSIPRTSGGGSRRARRP
jgi:hypothetical protein